MASVVRVYLPTHALTVAVELPPEKAGDRGLLRRLAECVEDTDTYALCIAFGCREEELEREARRCLERLAGGGSRGL